MNARPETPSKSSGFLWQGVLLMSPIAVLSIVGVLFLSRDFRLAEVEARDRAQAVAQLAAGQWWTALESSRDPTGRPLPEFVVDACGELIDPPPFDARRWPLPLDPAALPSAVRDGWQRLHAVARDASARAQARRDAGDLLGQVPSPFAGAVLYRRAMLALEDHEAQSARDDLLRLLREFPNALGSSGLPLGPLASFKQLELAAHDPTTAPPEILRLLNDACAAAVTQPSCLSERLLDGGSVVTQRIALEAQIAMSSLGETPASARGETESISASKILERWRLAWRQQMERRALHQVVQTQLRSVAPSGSEIAELPPRAAWFQRDGENWLAILRSAEGPRFYYVCRHVPRADSSTAKTETLWLDPLPELPPYLRPTVEIAGRPLGEPTPTNVFASASLREGGREYLRVSFSLTSPEKIFERPRERARWFAVLLVASAAAALIGLVATRRAHRRQAALAELKSNFVSSVTHELRAPIASVRLMAEGLERGRVTEPVKQREYFRFIGQECRRLTALIENVLDFSRIEQGRQQYEFEPTDVAALLAETARVMEPVAAERSVRLELRSGATLDLAPTWDGRAIQRALMNLIDNALKHSPPGESVTLSAEANGDAKCVVLWVEDRGPGIPPEEQQRIFDRFYRRGTELRRETQGVGIGLSLVKYIAEAHGGRVIVRSDVGKGSRFILELPLHPPDNGQVSPNPGIS